MSVVDSVKEKLDEYEYIVKAQMAEIDRLREEVARLTAEADAHTTLRSIYTNPEASRTDRVKAAAASLPFERPKLMPERAPLELQAAEIIPLRQLVDQRRARSEAFWGPKPSANNGSDEPSTE